MLASRQRLSSEMRTQFAAKPQRRGRLPGFTKKYRRREGSHRELFLPSLMLASRQRLSSEMRTQFAAKPQRRGRLPGSTKNTGGERHCHWQCALPRCLQASLQTPFVKHTNSICGKAAKTRSTARFHQKIQGMLFAYPVFFGGTGESRTRVRKPLDTTFSVGS